MTGIGVTKVGRHVCLGLSDQRRVGKGRITGRLRSVACDVCLAHSPHLEVAQVPVGEDGGSGQQEATTGLLKLRGERHAGLEVVEADSHVRVPREQGGGRYSDGQVTIGCWTDEPEEERGTTRGSAPEGCLEHPRETGPARPTFDGREPAEEKVGRPVSGAVGWLSTG